MTTKHPDTARAMHGSEMGGQDMQGAPEQIWAFLFGSNESSTLQGEHA